MATANRKPKRELTERQRKFLKEFPKDLNATQAAIRAGYSPKTANEQGAQMVKSLKAHLQATAALPATAALSSQVSPPQLTDQSQSEMTRFLTRLNQLAYVDVRKMFDQHNNAIDIPDLPDDVAPAIAGFEITEEFEGRGAEKKSIGFTKKFKLVDPLAAILALGKVRGLYVEKGDRKPSPLEDAATDLLLEMRDVILKRQQERACQP